MGRLAARFLAIALSLMAGAGCDFVERVNSRAYHEYHESRWQAVVAACAEERETVDFPAEPPVPRVCRVEVEAAYRAVPRAYQAEAKAWREVTRQSGISVQFVAEMLSVLAGRDVVSIEKLAPQIDTYFAQQAELREAWGLSRANLSATADGLRSAWTAVWDKQDLKFDLVGDVRLYRQRMLPEMTAVRREALEHYHRAAYDRLAITYLFYDPPAEYAGLPPHVPQDCDRLAASLNGLEAALLVRYSLDLAIEQDVEHVQQIGLVDLSLTPWDEIKVPKGKYAAHRVNTAIARLKMLKYIDALLTECLDVLVYDVELEWRKLWPEHEMETNIFAYAGLPKLQPEEK